MTDEPLIALISATATAMTPARDGILAAIPQARIWNILDDRLLGDADAVGRVNEHLQGRMRRLIDHAVREGADAVVLTCSQYGMVAEQSHIPIPVMSADAAAFDAALASRPSRILVLASLDSAATDSSSRLADAVSGAGQTVSIDAIVSQGAFRAAKFGDTDALVSSLTTAVRGARDRPDVVLLAQYSLAPAAEGLAQAVSLPVVSGPSSTGLALAERLGMALA